MHMRHLHQSVHPVFVAIALTAGVDLVAETTGRAAAPTALSLLPDRLREERLGYAVTVSMLGRERSGEAEIAVAREPLERNGETQSVWRIAFREGPPAPRSEEFLLRSDDLSLLESYYDIGGVRFAMRFDAKFVTLSTSGAIASGPPEERPLSAQVIADWIAVLPAVPLADGLEAAAHTFHMVHGAMGWKLAVVGQEAVLVPAGTFDAYKVVLTCLADDSLSSKAWVTKNRPYRIVRRESQYFPAPSMGRMVMELAHIGPAERIP